MVVISIRSILLTVNVNIVGMGYLAAAFATDIFGGANMTRVISGIQCKGNSNIQNHKYHQLNPIFRIQN